MRNLVIKLENDSDTDDPCEFGTWEFISFNNNHTTFRDPHELIEPGPNGEVRAKNIGLQRKLQVGTAFLLSCYEHSGTVWSLMGSGMQCRFDTTRVAGILLYTDKPKQLPKTLEKREKVAEGFLETYNDWCNGNCYWYCIETLDGEEIHACGGFIGEDHLEAGIKEYLQEGDKVKIEGEAKWLADHMDLSPATIVKEHGNSCGNCGEQYIPDVENAVHRRGFCCSHCENKSKDSPCQTGCQICIEE